MKKIILIVCAFSLPNPLFGQPAETLKLLQELIRIDTSNPPGNETAAARHIHNLLTQEGIPSEVIESAPGRTLRLPASGTSSRTRERVPALGRGNLIARLRGNGSQPAMILLGHLDVVPADASEWSTPPFEATIRGEKVWGRGALDMKGLVAMEVVTFLRLKREGVPLAGDLILVLCADEEAGGRAGAEFLVKNHWKKIEAKYLFNEGSVGIRKEGLHIYPIQVAEKGVAWMRIRARGHSGHGSMPTDDNAVASLAEAVDRLAKERFPVQKTRVLESFLKNLSEHLPFPKNLGARYFFAPLIGPVIQTITRSALAKEPAIRAVLSHTITPTMLSAGYKANVIPAVAEATLDARILPGETPEGFAQKIREKLKNFEVELLTTSIPNESDFNTPFFKAIEKAIRRQDPQAITAPMISTGATDSRFFRKKGVIAYGIIPLLLNSEELEGLHGKDERIPIEGLEKGTQIVFDIVREMQGVKW